MYKMVEKSLVTSNKMQVSSEKPKFATFINIFPKCVTMGALEKFIDIH